MSDTVTFIADAASYQKGLVPSALRPACAGLMIKCTQGSGYVDPYYASWLAATRAAGLLAVAYHYPDSSPAVSQASNLAGHIGDPAVPVMIDVEQVGLAQAMDVADAMTSAHLHPRLTYLSRSYWSSLGSPDLAGPLGARKLALINASYPSSATGAPANLYPGNSASEWDGYGNYTTSLWQFTDRAALDGQRIDVSAFRGSATQLAALLDTTAPTGTGGGSGSSGSTASWPTQSPGAVNAWVTVMQRALMLAGCDPKGVDGHYGSNTGAALKAAQHAFGISVDGVCGPITWSHLRARTLTVQRALVKEGLGAGGTDSVAGPLTAQELLAAQRAHHLLADGICGAHTSRALGIAAL